jgi:hypothetical protein
VFVLPACIVMLIQGTTRPLILYEPTGQNFLIRPRLVVGIRADFPGIALKNQIRRKVPVEVFSATVRLLDSSAKPTIASK